MKQFNYPKHDSKKFSSTSTSTDSTSTSTFASAYQDNAQIQIKRELSTSPLCLNKVEDNFELAGILSKLVENQEKIISLLEPISKKY